MFKRVMKQTNNMDYEKYLLSKSWRCPDAPLNPAIELQVRYNTGSHYWKEFKAGKPGEFYCRYCFEVRKFGTN